MMTENYVTIKAKCKDKKLIFNSGNQLILDNFVNNLSEGQVVYILLEAGVPNKSASQRNIFNLNARKIAEKQGMTVQEIKQIIKDRCGLGYKSSEECSISELQLLIEETKTVCNAVDLPFIGI